MCNGSGNHRVASFAENYLWERASLKEEQNSVCLLNGCTLRENIDQEYRNSNLKEGDIRQLRKTCCFEFIFLIVVVLSLRSELSKGINYDELFVRDYKY